MPLVRDVLDRRRQALYEQRDRWKTTWQDISDYIMPDRSFFQGRQPNRGERRDSKIYDSTPVRANRVLAAGMQSGLTSPSRPWFRLSTQDPELSKRTAVRLWLDEVQRVMTSVFAQSNFYNALHNVYAELGAFGTGPMLMLADFKQVIRCRPLTCGEYALGAGADNVVDSLYRTYWMTANQMVQEFGLERCSTAVQNAYRSNPEMWFEVHHAIEPNDERIPGKLGIKNAPYRSVYWEAGAKGDTFLKVSGFNSCPIMAPRWDATASDVYGRGPGWVALADAKMLMALQKDKLVGLDKVVNPPLAAPAGSEVLNVLPGGVSFYDPANPGNGIRAAYEVHLPLQELRQEINETQSAIEKDFFNDLFLMLAFSDQGTMTAREVVERHEEKLLGLGPVLHGVQSELLDPAIDRAFDLVSEAGLIPEAPQELAGETLRVEYISILAQAQKMVGITAVEQLTAYVGNVASAKPEVLDKFNADEAVDAVADMLGTPAAIVNSEDVVAEIRAQRAEQQAMMARQQEALALVQGAKTLSETDTGSNNALTALIGAPGGQA